MIDAKLVVNPMNSTTHLTAHNGDSTVGDPSLYRSIVRVLQYITPTQPYINFSIKKACQFMSNPLQSLEGS